MELFSRQILVEGIGIQGQRILRDSRTVVVGAGALGSTIAELLARMGVGSLRIVDRDLVDLTNIARSHLLDYEDYVAMKPKAVAVAEKISKIYPSVRAEPLVANVDQDNAIDLIEDSDIVLEGLDNLESKLLLNEASVKLGKPYIYSGVEGHYGTVIPVIPRKTPCVRCLLEPRDPGAGGCDVIGTHVLAVTVVSAVAVSLAIKILLGRSVEGGVYYVDSSGPEIGILRASRRSSCPVCSLERYEMLDRPPPRDLVEVCGTPGTYLIPGKALRSLDLNGWGVEIRGQVTIYRMGEAAIYDLGGHAIAVARTKEARAVLERALGSLRARAGGRRTFISSSGL